MATHKSKLMSRSFRLAFGVAALTLAAQAHATVANTLYSCNFAGASSLFRVNHNTGSATAVGPMGIQCTDIAFRGHELYATTFTSLYRVNPDTGNAAFVGNVGAGDVNALAVNPLTGRMYGAGSVAGAFYEINPATGGGALIGFYGAGLSSAGDLAMLNNIMYATVNRAGFPNTWLVRVNLTTGAATLIGDMGRPLVFGLSVRGGRLYATTNTGAVVLVNKATGATSLIGNNGVAHGGQTTSPNW